MDSHSGRHSPLAFAVGGILLPGTWLFNEFFLAGRPVRFFYSFSIYAFAVCLKMHRFVGWPLSYAVPILSMRESAFTGPSMTGPCYTGNTLFEMYGTDKQG